MHYKANINLVNVRIEKTSKQRSFDSKRSIETLERQLKQARRAVVFGEKKIANDASKCSDCDKNNIEFLKKRIVKLEREIQDRKNAASSTPR